MGGDIPSWIAGLASLATGWFVAFIVWGDAK
jgi:hypothetical protein